MTSTKPKPKRTGSTSRSSPIMTSALINLLFESILAGAILFLSIVCLFEGYQFQFDSSKYQQQHRLLLLEEKGQENQTSTITSSSNSKLPKRVATSIEAASKCFGDDFHPIVDSRAFLGICIASFPISVIHILLLFSVLFGIRTRRPVVFVPFICWRVILNLAIFIAFIMVCKETSEAENYYHQQHTFDEGKFILYIAGPICLSLIIGTWTVIIFLRLLLKWNTSGGSGVLKQNVSKAGIRSEQKGLGERNRNLPSVGHNSVRSSSAAINYNDGLYGSFYFTHHEPTYHPPSTSSQTTTHTATNNVIQTPYGNWAY